MTDAGYAQSIELPTDQLFECLKNAKIFALDIGGSLAKVAYYSTVTRKRTIVLETNKNNSDSIYKVSEQDELRDQLHFIKFETKLMDTCIDFLRENLIGASVDAGKTIKVTGGGAYKYREQLSSVLGVQVDKEDEMECMIKGSNFLLKNIPDEAFSYHRRGNPEYFFEAKQQDSIYPYLLVNIGSGVSFLKVEGENQYERIGGTSLGGGTFWGLGSLLTKAKGFDELLHLAESGDHRNIDILVKDIYGGSYKTLGLSGDLIASSFCKAARSQGDAQARNFKEEDVAKSLLISISNDIGQIAYLNAKLHGLHKIYFGGFFIRGHPMTMYTISYAINYWSKASGHTGGTIKAMFLRHEGYLGAIGAFLKTVEEQDKEKYSWNELSTWGENYAGSWSKDLQSPKLEEDYLNLTRERSSTFDMLELDRFAKPLVACPLLLDPASYFPDAVDLTKDKESRDYWLQCFEDAMDKFIERAIRSQPSKADAEKRAEKFKRKYILRLNELKTNPCAYGSLTVRSLLEAREHCMEEYHFVDPYSQQKQTENELALKHLEQRLKELDSLDPDEKELSLAKGILAGNVFDWGAKEVAKLLESESGFSFTDALAKLQERPWLFDNFDSWKERMNMSKPHRCAAIFVDNSGMDIILGIFPLTRHLLQKGTKVILCANSRPALNDVTYNELTILTRRVALLSHDIDQALIEGRLLVMESGQSSPCLDLRYIDSDLAEKMKELDTDLLILEGMGRAVHTNFYASFNCDVLKVAVLKNQWLANHLGGDMFSIMFQFERSAKVISSSK